MRALIFLILALISSLSILGPVQDTNTSQGLYWGVREGDTFNYSYSDVWSYSNLEFERVEEVQLYIYSLPTIPDPFNLEFYDYFQLAKANFIPLFMNETDASDKVEFGIGLFPLGNWSLISEVCEGTPYIATSETDSHWSYSTNYTVWPFPIGEYRYEGYYEYSKTTGLLTYSTLSLTNLTNGQVVRQREIARIRLPMEYLLGGGISITIILIALLIIRRRRA